MTEEEAVDSVDSDCDLEEDIERETASENESGVESVNDLDESDEDEDESGSGEDEQESDESESSSSGDSSEDSTDSGEEDDIWDMIEEPKEEKTEVSSEAHEAAVLRAFREGQNHVAKGRMSRAAQIFNDLLEHPLVSFYTTTDFDWTNTGEEKLSKMARVFVGIHKNLALLNEDNAGDHYLQILAVAPRNSQIWIDLAMKCIQKGDLSFASFALENSESENVTETRIGVLYLAKQYHACLHLIKEEMDRGTCSKKSLFLKEKIRSTNRHYRKFCDNLFEENRDYETFARKIGSKEEKEFTAALQAAEDRQNVLLNNPLSYPEPEFSPIVIPIEAEYSLTHVCTIFCDVFDRIQAYSSLLCQPITFSKWDRHGDFLDVQDTLNDILDTLDVLEDVTSRASPSYNTQSKQNQSKEKEEIFRRRSIRKVGVTSSEIDGDEETDDEAAPEESIGSGVEREENILMSALDLSCGPITPLRTAARPSRTPTPVGMREFIDEEFLLIVLRERLREKECRIYDIIETVLLELAELCPTQGALPKHLYPVMTQLYRRLNMMNSHLDEEKYARMHVLMDELEEVHGRDNCIRRFLFNGLRNKELAMRFAWMHAKLSTDTGVRVEFLTELDQALDEDVIVPTAKGFFCKYDVQTYLERLNKSDRVLSIRELKEAGLYNTVVDIVERDVDFNLIDDDDLLEMVAYWMDGLLHMEAFEKAVRLANRILHFLLGLPSIPEMEVTKVLDWVMHFNLSEVDRIELETLAALLCRLTPKFPASWMVWKSLYGIVRVIEGGPSPSYIRGLNATLDDGAMPSRSLDVLLKAHEELGEAKICGQNKGTFLEFYLTELYNLISDSSIKELLLDKQFAWLWANVLEEIAQCLYCMFGKYSKKRKPLEEHECRCQLKPSTQLAEIVIPLAMPHPMPLYDDKEKLGHDVVELIQSKFPFLLEVSSERRKCVDEVNEWMKRNATQDLSKKEGGRVSWPQHGGDSELQSTIWYVMALHHFRQNSHEEAHLYSQLFLSSGHATHENRLTVSAWAILAHSTIFGLFQLSDEQMLNEWEWRTMPFRIALSVCDDSLAVLHFQLGSALYQIATCLARFLDALPEDDFRVRRRSCIGPMRLESESHFELALSQSQPTEDMPYEEFHWLCYFFLAKLYAKHEDYDVVKVADCLFEAACSIQLSQVFSYPVKISAKKQQNIEPLELHYQMYSVVWKFINGSPNAPIEQLTALLSYARAFQAHKVVRSNLSLFTCHPELHEVAIQLTLEVAASQSLQSAADSAAGGDKIEEDKEKAARKDLMNELRDLCYKGFEQVCDRFAHPKARYRLAEMELVGGNLQKASDHLMKGVFRKKKRDDDVFENVIELSSKDVDRAGCFGFHVERSVRLAVYLCRRMKDVAGLVGLLIGMARLVENNEGDMLPLVSHRPLVFLCLRSFREIMSNGLSQSVKSDICRLWTSIEKPSPKMLLKHMKVFVSETVEKHYGPMSTFVTQQAALKEAKKPAVRKRKLTSYDLAVSSQSTTHPAGPSQTGSLPGLTGGPMEPKRVPWRESIAASLSLSTSKPAPAPSAAKPASSAASSAATPSQPDVVDLSTSDDDIQILEDPLHLMQMAMRAAGGLP